MIRAESIRIAVADSDVKMLQYYRDCIPRLGHRAIAAVDSVPILLDEVTELHPDLVIIEAEMPEMNGLAAAEAIYAINPTPIIIITESREQAFIDGAGNSPIMAYLFKPIEDHQLRAAITVCRQRFSEFRSMSDEAEALRQAIEDRKIIEKAKGVLMKTYAFDEEAAFHHLQSIARNQNVKMASVANIILDHQEFSASLPTPAKSRSPQTG